MEYVRNLPVEMQEKLRRSPIQNYIPWRSVWNTNSLTTRCRIVFDASPPTSSSFSLNDVLAKGRNNMNKLAEIVIRWRSHICMLITLTLSKLPLDTLRSRTLVFAKIHLSERFESHSHS